MFADQGIDHRGGPVPGKLDIVGKRADIVSVANHIELQAVIYLEHLDDFGQGRFGLRLEIDLVRVKKDAVHNHPTGFIDAVCQCIGIGYHILLHQLFFDNVNAVLLISHTFHLGPDFLVLVDDSEDGKNPPSVFILIDLLSADSLDGIELISGNLQTARQCNAFTVIGITCCQG